MYQSNLMDNSPTAGSNNPVISSGIKSYADSAYTLPVATSSTLGGVKKGSNITIANDGTIDYTLPTASSSTKGGVKVGSNISVASDGTISTHAQYTLPNATTSTKGGVIVGSGLNVSNGTISLKPWTKVGVQNVLSLGSTQTTVQPQTADHILLILTSSTIISRIQNGGILVGVSIANLTGWIFDYTFTSSSRLEIDTYMYNPLEIAVTIKSTSNNWISYLYQA